MRQTNCARTTKKTACYSQSNESEIKCDLTRKGPLLKNNKQPSVESDKKGTVPEKQIVSFHKKRTAPNQTNCCITSQESDRSLKNKLLYHLTRKGPLLKNKLNHLTRKGPLLKKKTKTPIKSCLNRSQNASGSQEPCHNIWHGFATRDSYRREFCITPSVVKQCLKKILRHFAYCPRDPTRSVQWVMIQDKPGRVLRSVVLDHSWTPLNQRPSDSRNCCGAREEPQKPCWEILFSSTLFFSMETS